ncbi:uncharacterized protein LOC135485677 [Lineus longissimus]|uniref:uncharacterized protein LOC135485677 n=1 Tax=Lineus longissimus TaxID=88925 RepID=UPI00315DF38A
MTTNLSRFKLTFASKLPFLFVVAPGLYASSKCISQTLQGIEPKQQSEAWGTDGFLNIFMAKSYTFQEGYLIGWQMYNRIDSDSYFVDVFRPVAGAQGTFDLVHSTKVNGTTAGNKTILVATAFKVQTGDYIGVHTDGSGTYGLAMELSRISSADWPIFAKRTFSDYFVKSKRVSLPRYAKGRQVALRAVVVSDPFKGTGTCDQYFVKLSTILTKSVLSQVSHSAVECSFLCVRTASCNSFSFDSTTNICKLYFAVKTHLSYNQLKENTSLVDEHWMI